MLPNYGKPYADAVAKLYVDVAREEKIIRVPCFVCGVGITPGMMQADGIHPNEKAQPDMLDAVWPHIQAEAALPGEKAMSGPSLSVWIGTRACSLLRTLIMPASRPRMPKA